MSTQAPTPSFPLERLLHRLQGEGFELSVADYLRAQQVLLSLGPELLHNPQDLQEYLAPILAKSPGQQSQFYAIYEAYFKEISQKQPTLDSNKEESLAFNNDPPSIPDRRKQWLWLGGLLIGILALAYGLWVYINPNPAEPQDPLATTEPDTLFSPLELDTSLSPLELDTPNVPEARIMLADVNTAYTAGDTLYFTNQSPNREQYDFVWDFGDGSRPLPTSDPVVSHPYTQAGTYALRLSLIQADSVVNTARQSIQVLPSGSDSTQKSPDCRPLLDIQIQNTQPIRLGDTLWIVNQSRFLDGRPAPELVFDLGDGQSLRSAQSSVSHVYQQAGSYTLSVSYRDLDTCSATVQEIIQVDSSSLDLVALPKLVLEKEPLAEASLRTLPGLWLYLLGIILLLWITLEASYQSTRSGYWLQKMDASEEPPYFLQLPNQDGQISLGPDWDWGDYARVFKQRDLSERQQLNISQSIRASIQAGGFPKLHFSAPTRPVEYLVLIDQKAETSSAARLFAYLVKNLVREEVLLQYFYFDREPGLLWNEAHTEQYFLEQIQTKYPHHRLILFSRGQHWINPKTAQIRARTLKQLSPWAQRSLMTPTPLNQWSYEEEILNELFILLPAGIEGQLALLEWLDQAEKPSLSQLKNHFRFSPSPTTRLEPETLFPDFYSVEGLKAYLGDNLFTWICALSVIPDPEWEMVIAIGKGLENNNLLTTSGPDANKVPEVNVANLRILSQIPWLSEEESWDTSLRRELKAHLSPEAERAARESVRQVLEDTDWQERSGSLASQKAKSMLTIQLAYLYPEDPSIQRELKRLWKSNLLQDELQAEQMKRQYKRIKSPVYLRGLSLTLCCLFFFWCTQGLQVQSPCTQALQLDTLLIDLGLVESIPIPIDSAQFYNNRGVAAYERQNRDSARFYFQKAHSLDSNYLKPVQNLARLYYNLGRDDYYQSRFEEAIGDFKNALTPIFDQPPISRETLMDPDSLDFLGSLRVFLELNPAPAPTQDKLFPDMLHGLGLAYFFLADTSQARAYADLLIELSPDFFLPGADHLLARLDPNMVLVQGGTFQMDSEEYFLAKPIYVTLSDYYIGRTEVTVGEYQAYAKEMGLEMPAALSSGWQADHPIAQVTWYDAARYCNWRSQKEGYTAYYIIDEKNRVSYNSQSKGYRLPSEAQWEFAARGGNLGKEQNYSFSGGNKLDSLGWYNENSNYQTHPVAQKYPNALGLYDMSGNVWEWCDDWYADYPSKAQTNPINLQEGDSRVLRGGSWSVDASSCRVAYRGSNYPDYRSSGNGFRLSRTL